MRLQGRTAIITGAASGLGKAIATRFAAEGAHVVIADVDADALAGAVDDILASGGQATPAQLDVTDRDQVFEVVEGLRSTLGPLDILVNNAGITRYRPFLTADGADWDAVLDVDLKGVVFVTQAVAPQMIERGYGKIVNISSVAGTGTTPHTATGPAGAAAYASAKAAVIQLTKSLAREFGPHGINVNSVAPGSFQTPITASTRTPEELEEHTRVRSRAAVLGRQGKVEELASAVLFLASDEASFITGHTLYVDGGRTDRM